MIGLLKGQLEGNLYWQWVMKAGLWSREISGAKPPCEMPTASPKFDADKDGKRDKIKKNNYKENVIKLKPYLLPF